MPRHAQHRKAWTLRVVAVVTLAVALVAAAVIVILMRRESGDDSTTAGPCPVSLSVITASTYLPVLEDVAPVLATGPDCVALDVRPIDGRAAAGRVAGIRADLWIPDDAAWVNKAPDIGLAKAPAAGAGTVLASSPVYLVSNADTAQRVIEAGGGWRGLVGLAQRGTAGGARLAVPDPAGSGDGLLAAGALGEVVWNDAGMDASAEALSAAALVTRTVPVDAAVLPPQPGEVGLVTERALLSAPATVGRDTLTITAPNDYTAALRYSFQPTEAAASDPVRGAALGRLLGVLTGRDADQGLAEAGLRRPDAGSPPGTATGLPPTAAPMFDVLDPHHVDHVFATWYAEDRRSDVLVVVDVSGSMASPAPGTETPLINLVGESVAGLAGLLPDNSRLALWEFGSHLDGDNDARVLVPADDLDPAHRVAVGEAIGRLQPQQTGTGLHDTILLAYLAARDTVRPYIPSHVVVFTDGRNQDDDPTLSLAQLTEQLTKAADPARPVLLTVITFGPESDAQALTAALEPVRGYVDPVTTAGQVRAAFLHAAAGGQH